MKYSPFRENPGCRSLLIALEFALPQLDYFLRFLLSFLIMTKCILYIISPHPHFCFDCVLVIKDERAERAKNRCPTLPTEVVRLGRKSTASEVKQSAFRSQLGYLQTPRSPMICWASVSSSLRTSVLPVSLEVLKETHGASGTERGALSTPTDGTHLSRLIGGLRKRRGRCRKQGTFKMEKLQKDSHEIWFFFNWNR